MEVNKEEIEFIVLSEEEIMQRCIIEVNGLSGSNFALINFEKFEVPLCRIRANKWNPQTIFLLGKTLQRLSVMSPDEWRIPK